MFANTSGVVLRCLQREMASCPHSSLLLGHLLLLRGGVLDLIDLSSSMLAPTVMVLYQKPAGQVCSGKEGCISEPRSFPAPCWFPLDSTGKLKTAVLPFIIGKMVAGCVGVGIVPRTAPVALSFVDPLEE